MIRDDKWLFSKLDEVWDLYFVDVPQDNDVKIVWGRRARSRLGSIKLASGKKDLTVITINSLFRDVNIPEFVIQGIIAHELSHYTHGFNSPLERRYRTPHAGGVVTHELRRRGLEEIVRKQKKWLKENWENYLNEKHPRKTKRRVRIKWI
jgi:predicted metal-dependent hydrolase